MRKTLTATVVAGISALALPLAMTTAQADPAHAKTVTPSTNSEQYDAVMPLAGSASTLVFVRAHRLARDADKLQGIYPNPSGQPLMYARSTTGKLKTVGVKPDETGFYSLSGTSLAAGNYVGTDSDDSHLITTKAYEWNTTTGVRHALTLPADSNYLAAAPNGVVFVAGQAIKVRTVSGTTSTLATPFGAASTDEIVSAASDADGVVVANEVGKIAYIPFAAPHTVVTLASPTTDYVQCRAVAGAYAACTSQDTADGSPGFPETAYLLPINGDPATTQATSCGNLIDATVAGSNLIWSCLAPSGNTVVLKSQPAGSTSVATAGSESFPDLGSAYGDAIAISTNRRSLLSGATADALTTLIAAKKSPVSADQVAVAGNKIVYTDDQPVASRGGQIVSAFTRTASVKHSKVTLGAPKLLSKSKKQVAGGLVGASASVAVYATNGPEGDGFPISDLHVVYKGHESTVSNAITYSQVQVSGTRVLYVEPKTHGLDIKVFDAATKKTKVVRHVKNYAESSTGFSGHYIAYATSKGAILRENIKTGKTVTIAAKQKRPIPGVRFSVYMSGNWIGWTAQPIQHELSKAINNLRNGKTLGKTIKLPHTLYSLTSAGALLDTSSTQNLGFTEPDGVAHPTAFWLHSYSGHTKQVLSKQLFVIGPQVAGKLIAWAGDSGVLKVAPLP